jgi:hypothetical protein
MAGAILVKLADLLHELPFGVAMQMTAQMQNRNRCLSTDL